MTALKPLPGFNPLLLQWGGPDEVVSDQCSYCDAPIGGDEVPLRLWNEEGWAVQFCNACMVRWFGFSP
jgi:hypothetical protein